MAMREVLERAMSDTNEGDAAERLRSEGLAIVNEDMMCKAIHEVFCGQLADHSEPNEKDRQQARALIGALQMTAADEMTL